jgi:hypothetical protein
VFAFALHPLSGGFTVFRRFGFATLLAASLAVSGVSAAEKQTDVYTFGSLKAMPAATVQTQAQEWLASTGKTDEATRKQFDAIWSQADKPLLDKIADTLCLEPKAAELLKSINDGTAIPKEVPAIVKDTKQAPFYRANLALVFAKAISSRRVYEEALEALNTVKPEQVSDPSAYFFHKAVAEHALTKKEEASHSIVRLLDDVADAPDRYKMVATLMFLDMQTWKSDEKDLMNITKLMDNSERRLDLFRAGKKTQDIQKKIVFRLDEVIKELENQAKSGGT